MTVGSCRTSSSRPWPGQPLTVYGHGDQTRSFCYVDDLIEGIIRLFERGTEDPVNIGNPNEFTVRQLAERVIALTGSQSAIVERPLPTDDPKVRKPDISLAKSRLDWEPTIALDDGAPPHHRVFPGPEAGVTAKWVVTGAAGFIGSHVCEALVARGDAVIGVDNFDPFYARAIKERNLGALQGRREFQLRELDCADPGLPWDGIDGVIHLAAKAGVRPSLEDPAAYVRANVLATVQILEGARRAGIRRIVLASSSSVYGDTTTAPFGESAAAVEPVSPYAASKRAGELMAEAFAHLYGARIANLRYFTVYGPRQRPDLAIHKFTASIARGESIRMFGDGSTERDYTYVSDVVDGTLAALEWTGRAGKAESRAFNIGGGGRVRLDRLIALIGEALGVTPRIERAPMQPGDVVLTAADLSRAEQELGYRPRVGIEEGIRQFVTWYEGAYGRQS